MASKQMDAVEVEFLKYSKLSGLAKMQAADGLMCAVVELARVLFAEQAENKARIDKLFSYVGVERAN